MKVSSPGARRQAVLGALIAALLCGIGLAGADHPPPPGFVILVAAIAAWCGAVSLTRWRVRLSPHTQQLAVTSAVAGFGGVVAWLALMGLAMATHGITIDAQALIGLGVAALLAACTGACLAVASWFVVDPRQNIERGPGAA